jgi:hypothetical protein
MKNILHMSSIIGLSKIKKLCHFFSNVPNSCYSIMVETYAIEHRPVITLVIHKISFLFKIFALLLMNKHLIKNAGQNIDPK